MTKALKSEKIWWDFLTRILDSYPWWFSSISPPFGWTNDEWQKSENLKRFDEISWLASLEQIALRGLNFTGILLTSFFFIRKMSELLLNETSFLTNICCFFFSETWDNRSTKFCCFFCLIFFYFTTFWVN